ncbi:MAG: ABC transporter substrate-binding protein [Burkholderiales bacterium]
MSPPDSGSPIVDKRSQRQQGLFPISMVVADYDRTRPLVDGRVKPEGIALNAKVEWVGDFCTRPVYEQYDAAEISLSWYLAARDRGENCIAIPVFPLRDPIWAFMYVREDSPITKPTDLIGKRIGMQGYRYTVNLWLRGLLKEYYGFSPEQATWVTSEIEGNGYEIPKNIPVELSQDKSPVQKLKDGEVDAVWLPRVPQPFQAREPWIRRLFPDCQGEVHRFVKRTGLLPFSHAVVINKSLAEREPWIAKSLFNAFVEAQRVADEICQIEKMTSYVDSMFILEAQQAVYGPSPFEHGLGEANRRVMETFVRYAHEQGYISRRLSIEELFAVETLGQ